MIMKRPMTTRATTPKTMASGKRKGGGGAVGVGDEEEM
jgi:hypothetical protein